MALSAWHLQGYNVKDGYVGIDPETGRKRLYASEADYLDEMEEDKDGEEEQ